MDFFFSFESDWIRSGPRGNRRFDPPFSSQPRMRYPFSRQLSCDSQYPQFNQLKLSLALGAQPALGRESKYEAARLLPALKGINEAGRKRS